MHLNNDGNTKDGLHHNGASAPIQVDEISSTTSDDDDDDDYHSDGIRWAQIPVNIEQENHNLLQRLDKMQADMDTQMPDNLRDNPQ